MISINLSTNIGLIYAIWKWMMSWDLSSCPRSSNARCQYLIGIPNLNTDSLSIKLHYIGPSRTFLSERHHRHFQKSQRWINSYQRKIKFQNHCGPRIQKTWKENQKTIESGSTETNDELPRIENEICRMEQVIKVAENIVLEGNEKLLAVVRNVSLSTEKIQMASSQIELGMGRKRKLTKQLKKRRNLRLILICFFHWLSDATNVGSMIFFYYFQFF